MAVNEFCRPTQTFGSNNQTRNYGNSTTRDNSTMSTGYSKRKRADADEGDHGRKHKQQKQFSKRPRPNRHPDHRNPYNKRGHGKSEDAKSAEEEAQKSINALKSRIRDLSRMLRHADSDEKSRMPQGIRIERERELESSKHELEERQTAQREAKFRSDIIGKYHMVRFFGELSQSLHSVRRRSTNCA